MALALSRINSFGEDSMLFAVLVGSLLLQFLFKENGPQVSRPLFTSLSTTTIVVKRVTDRKRFRDYFVESYRYRFRKKWSLIYFL